MPELETASAMSDMGEPADRLHFQIVIVGGGQAGLADGYYLAKRSLGSSSWTPALEAVLLLTPVEILHLPGRRARPTSPGGNPGPARPRSSLLARRSQPKS
jgi:glycine/D-amino acid oxidase-like deaminating enzyme